MRSRFLSLVVLALIAGCDDPVMPSASAVPFVPPGGAVAYLTVSDPQARPGSIVTVTAVVRQGGNAAVGAFKARLRYDAPGLNYVEQAELRSGMRAINPKDGEIIAAGASADGFEGGQLFAVRFKVVDPAALHSMRLVMAELTGAAFDSRLSALQVQPRIFAAPRQ